MRIAFVVHDYHRSGGHSRYVAELAERFSATNEVHVFANSIHENSSSPVQFHRVPAWRRSALTTIFTFLLPATQELTRDFDIVHAQGLCSLRADVLTAHICNRAWFTARQGNGNSLPWKERLFDGLVSPLEKRLYRRSTDNWVIAVSERIRSDIVDCYGRRGRTSVIYHGVDTEQFNQQNRLLFRSELRAQLGLAEDDFVFLFVGDLRKGAGCVIEALRQLPSGKLVLTSRTLPDQYRSEAERAGLLDRVIFCPPTDSIERYYAASDAFVFPTPYDAFGMVISEAMATGLPVITSREAGAAELIEHERNGLLLNSPSDAEEISQQMKRLIVNSDFCQRLGDAARAKMENYTWEKVAEQTMEVYRQVLSERAK